MTSHKTLILEIISKINKFSISLHEQNSTVHHYEDISISLQEVNKLCEETADLFNKTFKNRNNLSGAHSELKKIGQLLYDQLFPHNIKTQLRNTKIENLLVLIDENLVHIPWELLNDGDTFLCVRFNIGRNVKTRQTLRESGQRIVGPPIKMLILADPTNDLKSAHQEASVIEKELDKRRKILNVAKKVTNISLQYVKKNIRDYDIVHFAGHTDLDNEDVSNSGWRLSDDRFTANDIISMGSTIPLPSLIFSNSCQSAQISDLSLDKYFENQIFGLANAFLIAGVPHYIGTFCKIPDEMSLDFAKEFYYHVILGQSISASIRRARLKIIKDFGEDAIVWGSYVLYGDPTAALFKPIESSFFKKFKKTAINKLIVSFIILSVFSMAGLSIYHICKKLPTKNIAAYLKFKRTWKMFMDGKNSEVINICNDVLKQDPYYVDVYKRLGNIYDRIGESDKALEAYFDYLLKSQERSKKGDIANAKINIGWIYHFKGDFDNAYKYYTEALNVSSTIKDALTLAKGYRQLGLWYCDKGDLQKAKELLLKAIDINEVKKTSYNYRYNLACDYSRLAHIYQEMENYELAKDYYLKSKKVFEQLGSADGQAVYYANIAEIYCYEKNYDKALEFLMKSLEINSNIDSKGALALNYEMLGNFYREIGNTFDSINYLGSSLRLKEKIGDKLGIARVNRTLSVLYVLTGQKISAAYHLQRSLELYKSMGLKEYDSVLEDLKALNIDNVTKEDEGAIEINKSIEIVKHLAELKNVMEKGRYGQIIKYCEEGIRKNKELDILYYTLANLYKTTYYYDEALKYYFIDKGLLEKKQRNADLAQVNYEISMIYMMKQNYKESINYCKEAMKLFENSPDRSYIVLCKFGIAMASLSLNNFKDAKIQIDDILDLAEEFKSDTMRLYGYGAEALYYFMKDEKDKSKKSAEKILTITDKFLKLSIDSQEIRDINFSVSMILTLIGYNEKSIALMKEAIKHDEEITNRYTLYEDYKTMAMLYNFYDKTEEEIYYEKKALELAKDIGNEEQIIAALMSLVSTYSLEMTGKILTLYQEHPKTTPEIIKIVFDLSSKNILSLCEEALEISFKYNYYSRQAEILIQIASLYDNVSELEKALDSYNRALKSLDNIEDLKISDKNMIVNIYLNIARVYLNQGNVNQTLNYLDKFITYYSKEQNIDTVMIMNNIKLIKIHCDTILKYAQMSQDSKSVKDIELLVKKLEPYNNIK